MRVAVRAFLDIAARYVILPLNDVTVTARLRGDSTTEAFISKFGSGEQLPTKTVVR